jgi:hypothetical protein
MSNNTREQILKYYTQEEKANIIIFIDWKISRKEYTIINGMYCIEMGHEWKACEYLCAIGLAVAYFQTHAMYIVIKPDFYQRKLISFDKNDKPKYWYKYRITSSSL